MYNANMIKNEIQGPLFQADGVSYGVTGVESSYVIEPLVDNALIERFPPIAMEKLRNYWQGVWVNSRSTLTGLIPDESINLLEEVESNAEVVASMRKTALYLRGESRDIVKKSSLIQVEEVRDVEVVNLLRFAGHLEESKRDEYMKNVVPFVSSSINRRLFTPPFRRSFSSEQLHEIIVTAGGVPQVPVKQKPEVVPI